MHGHMNLKKDNKYIGPHTTVGIDDQDDKSRMFLSVFKCSNQNTNDR
jgi:hypothetical protein